jgi:asparagine N-glycosylation enzyme membrane subunit Stt3
MIDFLKMTGITGVLCLGYALFVVVRYWKPTSSIPLEIPLVFLAIFYSFMWLSTYDLDYMVSPFVTLVAGIAFYDLMLFSVQSQIKQTGIRKWVIVIPFILFFSALIIPFNFNNEDYPYILKDKYDQTLYTDEWYQAMDWLKENTPELSFPTDSIYLKSEYNPFHPENYGVLTSWDYGNIVNQRGHRIPSWSRWSKMTNEKLLIDPLDSLKLKIKTDKINFKYLVVALPMLRNFITNYKLTGYPLQNCIGNKQFVYGDSLTTFLTYGECLQNSLLYNTYVEPDTSLTWIKEVYRSPKKVIFGYFFDQGELKIYNFAADSYNFEDQEKLINRGYIMTREGLMYDLKASPLIRIFEISDTDINNY